LPKKENYLTKDLKTLTIIILKNDTYSITQLKI